MTTAPRADEVHTLLLDADQLTEAARLLADAAAILRGDPT